MPTRRITRNAWPTREQLVTAYERMRTQRDRALARAAYWHEQHALACRRLIEHVCDQACAPGAHHDCSPDVCAHTDCDCPCHRPEEHP